MSYEGIICPCGDKKPTNTMLCQTCLSIFADHTAMTAFKDDTKGPESRRNAAIILLTLARGRKGKYAHL